MNCAKCGLELPDGVKRCPKCGMVNEFEAAAPAARKLKPVHYAIATLALIVLASLMFVAVMAAKGNRNVTSAPGATGNPAANVVGAPPGEPNGGGVMTAPPANPGPGQTTPAGVTKPKPPQEVVDYLNFVKGVEAHRQMLLKDTTDALMMSAAGGQAQSMMNMIDMAMDPEGEQARDPLADSKKELNRQYKNWLSTLEYFDKKAAPAQCREFSGAYRNVIYGEAQTIGGIAVSFNSVNVMDPKDMSKLLAALQKMKGDPSIQQGIDGAADNADAKLTQVVAQYDMQKPFDVPREKQTSGNIMGF